MRSNSLLLQQKGKTDTKIELGANRRFVMKQGEKFDDREKKDRICR